MIKIRDHLFGDRKRFEQHYRKLYGKSDYTQIIDQTQNKIGKRYILLVIFSLILAVMVIAEEHIQSDRGIVIKDGQMIAIKRPERENDTVKVQTKVTAGLDDETWSQKLVLLIRSEAHEDEVLSDMETDETEGNISRLKMEVRKLSQLINKSDSGEAVWLPEEGIDGISLKWEESHTSNLPLALIGAAFVFYMIYKNRYNLIKKQEKEARESIIRELPDFINQFVLLLNAGMVLSAAFSKVLEGRDSEVVKSYFYLQLLKINRNMQETNSPLTEELKDFAKRSGVKELMRLSNIISDNVDKGADLVEKLQGESAFLWFTKKKLAEEKGRLAETKMTFPLMLLLLVLIMVTITPALMQM